MKRVVKYSVHALSILLVVAVMMPRMHHWVPEDANRDGQVGLRDTILLVKEFEDTASTPSGSLRDLPPLVAAFQVASGLKQVIQVDDHKGLNLDDGPYIPTRAFISPQSYKESMINDECPDNYASVAAKPLLPPPRFCL